jgi:omega-6 fatty acid desaturase (delta-12 desaturase)
VGHYYLVEIWWRHMMFPRAEDRERMSPRLANLDRVLVAAFIIFQIGVCVFLGRSSPSGILLNLALGIVWPQLTWNWLMGVVVLLHHTHPKVRWYDDPNEWSYYAGQVQGTVHVEFTWPIGAVLHHIMEHTAHHVDPRIPLYHLPAAQRSLEQTYSGDVIRSPFTTRNFLRILGQCQLYDYRRHCWLSFEGKVTSNLGIASPPA